MDFDYTQEAVNLGAELSANPDVYDAAHQAYETTETTAPGFGVNVALGALAVAGAAALYREASDRRSSSDVDIEEELEE